MYNVRECIIYNTCAIENATDQNTHQHVPILYTEEIQVACGILHDILLEIAVHVQLIST